MTPFLFILLASVTQALSVHAIRDIQARAGNIFKAVVWNYAVCALIGIIYLIITGVDSNWPTAVPYGIFTGLFYISSLLIMIRSMGQRGLAVTYAIANISMVLPVIIAIILGDKPSVLQTSGIALAAIAIPILSLCTASGKAIRELPSIKLALLLFFIRGTAAVGNLVAEDTLNQSVLPVYITSLFSSCLIFGLIALLFVDRKSHPIDLKLGATFGALNIMATSSLILALTKAPGSIVFASYNVIGMTLGAILAIWLWRERIQSWGWIGFILAIVASVMMRIT
jgi:multidrug transporter EmrE-like cation transporter